MCTNMSVTNVQYHNLAVYSSVALCCNNSNNHFQKLLACFFIIVMLK